MAEKLEIRVALKQWVLNGNGSNLLQRVATVYINGREYRVSAPPEAAGDALDWVRHFTVRQLDGPNSEIEIHDAFGELALKAVKEELEKRKREAPRATGLHPDGIHCAAQICLKGHVLHCDGMPFDSKVYCTKCGAACIDECPRCTEPIRGAQKYRADDYLRPQHCHGCGRPYPWMEERLQTARELLYHDDKLTMDDRTKLWDDLQYVMSDPKGDLVPSKKKLIEIRLAKATGYVREIILDLVAKTAAEIVKG
jgi:hypothetical protein